MHDAGLAPRMLQIGKRGMTGEVQGHGVDRAAGIPCERSREGHRLPAFLGSAHVEQNQPGFPASRPGTQRPWTCSALDLWPSTRRSRYSGATAQDRNELGARLVAAGLGPPPGHALLSLLALNGLRVSETTGADIDHLGLERGPPGSSIVTGSSVNAMIYPAPARPRRKTPSMLDIYVVRADRAIQARGRGGTGDLGPCRPGPTPAESPRGSANMSVARRREPGGKPKGNRNPGNGRRRRTGERRTTGNQRKAGEGEEPGGQTGNRRKARRGTGGHDVRPQTTR